MNVLKYVVALTTGILVRFIESTTLMMVFGLEMVSLSTVTVYTKDETTLLQLFNEKVGKLEVGGTGNNIIL